MIACKSKVLIMIWCHLRMLERFAANPVHTSGVVYYFIEPRANPGRQPADAR